MTGTTRLSDTHYESLREWTEESKEGDLEQDP